MKIKTDNFEPYVSNCLIPNRKWTFGQKIFPYGGLSWKNGALQCTRSKNRYEWYAKEAVCVQPERGLIYVCQVFANNVAFLATPHIALEQQLLPFSISNARISICRWANVNPFSSSQHRVAVQFLPIEFYAILIKAISVNKSWIQPFLLGDKLDQKSKRWSSESWKMAYLWVWSSLSFTSVIQADSRSWDWELSKGV